MVEIAGGEPGGRAPAPRHLRPIQQFLNSVNLESGEDDFADPDSLRDWLVAAGWLEADMDISPTELEVAVTFREALRDWLDKGRTTVAAEATRGVLNSIAAGCVLTVEFSSDGTRLEGQRRGFHGALSRLIGVIHDAAQSADFGRLKTCGRPVCRWAFYDRSNNRSGRWCSMTICGSREKAKTYRDRQVTH